MLAVLNGRLYANFPSITLWLRAKMPAATFRQSTKFAANRSKRRQNFNGSGSSMLLFRFSHIHGRLFKPPQGVYVKRYWLTMLVFVIGSL